MDRLHECAYQDIDPGGWPEDAPRVFDALGVSHLSPDELLLVARTAFLAHAVRVQQDVLLSLFPSEPERLAVGLTKADRIFDGGGAFTRWTETRRATREIFEREWHERFGLPDEWAWHTCIRAAAVHWPCRPPDGELGALLWATIPTLNGYDTVLPVVIETEWMPAVESRESFLGRVLSAAEAACDRIVAERQLEKVPQRLNAHLAWLARHVVGGESYADIARAVYPDAHPGPQHRSKARAVNDGARTAAELIGLTVPQR